MIEEPCVTIVEAWTRLVRTGQTLLAKVEGELKQAGLPPLSWYDVLLELVREPEGKLRPVELERRTLLAQYNASRLVDRLVAVGLVTREGCPEDRRGQFVVVTAAGREMQKSMWRVYGAALSRHLGTRLDTTEATRLKEILDKLL